MAPCETSRTEGLLEHPAEAFAHFRAQGVPKVMCQEKHMGSRAVAVIARDADAARRRFGTPDGDDGILYTRTGRRFFLDRGTETAVLERFRKALDAGGLWDELETDWVCLDCEVMPWSAKGGRLVREHYAPVAAAARLALAEAGAALARATARDGAHAPLLEAVAERSRMAAAYEAACNRYNWPVDSVEDLRIAPFHLLASEGRVHADRSHGWHMERLARLAADEPILKATDHRAVNVNEWSACAAARAAPKTAWCTRRSGACGPRGRARRPPALADLLPWRSRAFEPIDRREHAGCAHGRCCSEPF